MRLPLASHEKTFAEKSERYSDKSRYGVDHNLLQRQYIESLPGGHKEASMSPEFSGRERVRASRCVNSCEENASACSACREEKRSFLR